MNLIFNILDRSNVIASKSKPFAPNVVLRQIDVESAFDVTISLTTEDGCFQYNLVWIELRFFIRPDVTSSSSMWSKCDLIGKSTAESLLGL